MEVRTVDALGTQRTVLFDDRMEVVAPVSGYLEHLRLKDRAPTTLKMYAYDLKTYWEFLRDKGICFDEVMPDDINSFKAYLRSGSADVLALNMESARKSGKRYSPVSLNKFKTKFGKRVGTEYVLHTKPLRVDGGRVFLPLYMSIRL